MHLQEPHPQVQSFKFQPKTKPERLQERRRTLHSISELKATDIATPEFRLFAAEIQRPPRDRQCASKAGGGCWDRDNTTMSIPTIVEFGVLSSRSCGSCIAFAFYSKPPRTVQTEPTLKNLRSARPKRFLVRAIRLIRNREVGLRQ